MASSIKLVNNGKKILLDRFLNTTPTRSEMTTFQVGIGSTAPTSTDTSMETKVPIVNTELVDSCDSITGFVDSADMTITVNTTTFKQGTGSLNLTKDGTSSTDASTVKTVTSLDFTSKEIELWYYVLDTTTLNLHETTDCITINYGSDSSNYYVWTKNKADLSVGWNRIGLLTTSNVDSTTGTPSLTAMDYFKILITATSTGATWSAGAVAMDDIKIVSSDDYTKVDESGYPTVDYTTLTAELRSRINTVQAVGYPLTEVGFLNTDGTPLLGIRATFSAISKTLTDEVIFSIKLDTEEN